ncbi:MAG TPA: M48 family metallopeptidase [Steroidobacteraceae bacterium]|nr:M48 family metallopeptidase [Steroidobacteraceae bacterium]
MGEEFTALVFGPGLAPGGVQGTLVLSSLGVEVSAQGHAQRVDVASIALRKIGFEKPGVEISWQDGGETWAAHVLDHEAARRLLAMPSLAGTQKAQAFHANQQRASLGRKIGWTVLALFILLPAIVLLLLILNASTIAGWVADRIPVEQEMNLGRQAFAGMSGSLKLKDEGPAFDAVQSIVGKLTKGSRYTYDIHITDDPTLNAFAMPGGVIVVYTGLIAATKTPEELAGVLAHEVQHVELRHSIRGVIKDLGLRGLWMFVTGDLGSTMTGQAAMQLTSLKFSRDDEREADKKGFDALVVAGIDPSGLPALFRTMSEKAADAPVALISSHPLSKDREEQLRSRVASLREGRFEALGFEKWPPL